MSNKIQCISPVDGSVYAERPATTIEQARTIFGNAKQAQMDWAAMPLAERCALLHKAVDHFVSVKSDIAPELAWQMGRPVSQGAGEIGGLEERARHMIGIAPQALAQDDLPQNGLALRTIRREALGTVFVIAPWNFPLAILVGMSTAAAVTGPASGPRPTSSTPAIRAKPRACAAVSNE